VMTILTLVSDDSMGFGRVVRAGDGRVLEVVEEKVCTPEQLAIRELNCGVYCFDATWLWSHIDQIPLNPVKHEYFLTDMVGIAVADDQRVKAVISEDPAEVIGINTRVHLSRAEAILRRRVNEHWMLEGVTFQDPATAYVDATVEIGRDTVIHANTHLVGRTTIGHECVIGPNAIVRDSKVGDRCRVHASVLEQAVLEEDTALGPFAHLKPGAGVHRGSQLGGGSAPPHTPSVPGEGTDTNGR